MSFIAGGYTVTYNALTVGQIADGITIEHVVNKQLIRGDNEGQTVQDAVFQGHDVFAEMVLMEYDQAGALDCFWPYQAGYGNQGTIGRLDVASSIIKALVLTDVDGTPAATNPATLTADRAILQENFPVRLLYAPALRDIPLRLRLLPNASSAFFTLT